MRKKAIITIDKIIREELRYYLNKINNTTGDMKEKYQKKYDTLIKYGNEQDINSNSITDKDILKRIEQKLRPKDDDFKYCALFFNEVTYLERKKVLFYEKASSNENDFIDISSDVNDECHIVVLPSPEETTDFMNYEHFENLVKCLPKNTSIAISKIRLFDEYISLKELININNQHITSIGLIVDTESTFEYIDEYQEIDFAIIDLESIWEESFEGKYDYTIVLREIIVNLHQTFRKMKVKHYILLRENFEKLEVEKMIKRGIRGFVFNENHEEKIIELINDFMKTRGKHTKK